MTGPARTVRWLPYDRLVVATGAVPVRPPIAGLDVLGPGHGVHLLHTMADTLTDDLTARSPHSALIVGAGYIGLEMAEALRTRGLAVTMVERLPEVLPTVDPDLGALVAAELADHCAGRHRHHRDRRHPQRRRAGRRRRPGRGPAVPAGGRPRPGCRRRPPRHRAARRAGGCRRQPAVDGGRPRRRPQGLLPGRHPDLDAVDRGRPTGRLLGVQLVGRRTAEIAKRVDVAAAALFAGLTVEQVSDLDLPYTPPLGSPWDALPMGAQVWTPHYPHRPRA